MCVSCFLCFWFVYFRFLNIFIPLYSVACVKPASISGMASSIVLAVLHVHSSVSLRNVACSMFMYISVHLISLCPKTYLTCMMSLVLWYSIVPFQCLSVWKLIFRILGFCSFSTVLILWLSKQLLTELCLFGNMCSFVFG